MRKTMTAAAFAASLLLAAPSAGQLNNRPYDIGAYWNVSAIDVLDGHFEEYAAYLAERWRANQEFARSQGWILEYHVLTNEYPRAGEPDVYLITRFADMPSAAEIRRRDEAFQRHLQQSPQQQDQAFGERGRMRTPGSNWLLREMTFGNR